MEVNVGSTERIVRGVLGVALLGAGVSVGRRAWWGILLDVVGALLLLSAATGFCHVKKKLGVCSTTRKS